MSAARKRKRFASERQESGARSGRSASLSPEAWKNNDNLVALFCPPAAAVCSESGPKYDIATHPADDASFKKVPLIIAINHSRS